MNNSIDPVATSLYFTAAQEAKKKKQEELSEKAPLKKRRPFADLLREAQSSNTPAIYDDDLPPEIANMTYEKAVEYLLDSVYSSGDELRAKQTPDMVQQYKQAVKSFVHFVVKNCYEVEKHESSKMVRRRKKFYQIEIIDQKLDKLATEVLYNQRDQMAFLAKIDEIHGILVDLIT